MSRYFSSSNANAELESQPVRVLIITNLMGLIGSVLLAIILAADGTWYAVLPLLTFAGYTLGCLVLIRQGKVDVPKLTLPLIMVVLLTYVLFQGNGIHDIGMLGYPLVIVFAGLLLGRMAVLAFCGISLAGIAILVYAEMGGRLNPAPSLLTEPLDLLTIAVFLVVLALLLYITIENLTQSYRQARASEAKWQSLVDNVPAIIITANAEGVIQYVNSGEIGDPRKIVGKRLEEYLPREIAAPVLEAQARVKEERAARRIELSFDQPGGETTWYDVTIGPVIEGEKLAGFVAVIQDITEQKQDRLAIETMNLELEQRVKERTRQLELTNQELESFNYSVSHDLRAPLRAMNGFSAILLQEYGGSLPDEARRLLQVVRDNAMRMNDLIEGLLQLSRLNRKELEKTTVMPEEIVRELVQVFSPNEPGEAEEHRVKWIIHPMPACHADAGLLRQVYANLIENSVKFTRTRPEAVIELGATTDAKPPVYYVRDNGVGFEMRYASKVFGAFQRLHREDEYEGTGIGLATVQRIIHRHGGQVWCEAAPGEGATFYFTLGQAGQA